MAFADWLTFDGGNGYYYYIAKLQGYNVYYPWYDDSDVVVVGGGGSDFIVSGDGDDIVFGNAGQDTLGGGAGDDSVAGGSEADFIYTSEGYDTLNGGSDNDTLALSNTLPGIGWTVDLSNESAYQYSGNIFDGGQLNLAVVTDFENIQGSAYDDDIRGNDQDNIIFDGLGGNYGDNDIIWARGGNDTIILSAGGTDQVRGGAGEDEIRITGRSIESRLWGESGKDVFIFEDSSAHSGRIATIEDFNIQQFDLIQLDADIAFDEDGNGQIGQDTFWITQTGSLATIHVDNDGDLAANYTIDVVMIAGGQLLPEYDFILS